jgi:CPA2 family monovalent cation:H+ antiporter-2
MSDFGWIVLGLAALILVKATITFVTARMFGVGRGSAIELALLLAQAGEFAFVVITLAQRTPLLSPRLATAAVAVAGLSMLLTPLLAYAARQLAQRMTPPDTDAPEPGPDTDEFDQHVVIGGFGRVGQTIALMLEREHVRYIALDADPNCVAAQRRAGRSVYFADAGRAEILQRAGAARARAFVVTLDTPHDAERMVKAICALKPRCVHSGPRQGRHPCGQAVAARRGRRHSGSHRSQPATRRPATAGARRARRDRRAKPRRGARAGARQSDGGRRTGPR